MVTSIWLWLRLYVVIEHVCRDYCVCFGLSCYVCAYVQKAFRMSVNKNGQLSSQLSIKVKPFNPNHLQPNVLADSASQWSATKYL